MAIRAEEKKSSLRVGIDDAPPIPMQVGDPALGTFRGYEVDLLEAIAERLDRTIEYQRAWWSLITKELTAGGVDLVCSAATVTEERKAEVSFCVPHLRLQLALVARQNSPDPLDTAGSRFGVRRGTTAEEFLRGRLRLEPTTLSESNDELYDAVSKSQIDAVIDDSPIALHFAKATPGLSYRGPFANTEGEYAIMVAKGNDALKNEINAALAMLAAEGALTRLREQWFGSPAVLVA